MCDMLRYSSVNSFDVADLAAYQNSLFFAIKVVGKALDSTIHERFVRLASTVRFGQIVKPQFLKTIRTAPPFRIYRWTRERACKSDSETRLASQSCKASANNTKNNRHEHQS
jgi:hypothetical protein